MHQKSIYFLINSLEGWWAERVVTNLSAEYIKEWYKVFIITLKNTVFFELPFWVTHLTLSRIKNNILLFMLIPWYIFKFNTIIKTYSLDEWISFLEISNFVHVLARKNAVISFRTHISVFTGIVWWVYIWCIRWLYPKAKKIIVNSLENKYDLAKYLDIPEHKIEVLYNPLDKEKIARDKLEPIENRLIEKLVWKKVFITTGRLISTKHHEKIITWLSMIYHNINNNWIYLIIGDWPEKNKLQHLVQLEWLTDCIYFLWTQTNVFKYLQVADYFLYASSVEWFPNVLAEAKEIGIPIITSDFRSGAKEVILGKYTKELSEHISYPCIGKYGILLNLEEFEQQFVNWYRTTCE